MPNTAPSDLDQEALERSLAPVRKSFGSLISRLDAIEQALATTIVNLKCESPPDAAAILSWYESEAKPAIDALPRASGVPEAEAVAAFGLGKWMSAALDAPNVCSEMKADIEAWFKAGEPGHPLYASPLPVAAPSGAKP